MARNGCAHAVLGAFASWLLSPKCWECAYLLLLCVAFCASCGVCFSKVKSTHSVYILRYVTETQRGRQTEVALQGACFLVSGIVPSP